MSNYFDLIDKIQEENKEKNISVNINVEEKYPENKAERYDAERYDADKIYYFGQNKAIFIKKNDKKKEVEVICLEM